MAKQKMEKTNGIFSKIKLSESYASLILGAIVVLIIGVLFVSFAKINRNPQTSSIQDDSQKEEQNPADANISSTYTIRPGDDLWTISENVYNNGYKWVEIARVNKLNNPDLIHSGNKLTIPNVREIEQNLSSNKAIGTKKSIPGDTYAVVLGDNLWDISVRAYGDGFRWVEIAKANNLVNPDLIHSGNIFKIPR